MQIPETSFLLAIQKAAFSRSSPPNPKHFPKYPPPRPQTAISHSTWNRCPSLYNRVN
uniref:Uncharacterized protein n=1 Tax=Rhizophora mucronata TaxID=61149 RepID=A0A2P2K3A4_RHIMU